MHHLAFVVVAALGQEPASGAAAARCSDATLPMARAAENSSQAGGWPGSWRANAVSFSKELHQHRSEGLGSDVVPLALQRRALTLRQKLHHRVRRLVHVWEARRAVNHECRDLDSSD